MYASDARKEGRAMSLRMYNHAKRKEPDEVVDLLRNVSLSPSKKVRASTVRVASSFLSYLFHCVLFLLPWRSSSFSLRLSSPCVVWRVWNSVAAD